LAGAGRKWAIQNWEIDKNSKLKQVI
jgi:hypothetical protein